VLWLLAALVAVVSNLDNLAAGIAFGIRDTRIGAAPNTVIAVVTMAGTGAAMIFGRSLSLLMPQWLASDLGSLIIIAIGVKTVIVAAWTLAHPAPEHGPERLPRAGGGTVSCRKALLLGVALSLNNVGSGVGAGIAGVPPLVTTVLAGGVSLLCVGGGSRVGASVGRRLLGRRAPLVAGVVLVGVGTAMLSGAA
jgi:putative Mn2+ efflux pump MntP